MRITDLTELIGLIIIVVGLSLWQIPAGVVAIGAMIVYLSAAFDQPKSGPEQQ